MVNNLAERYEHNWDKICEHILLQIGVQLKKKEVTKFKEWFARRKGLGLHLEHRLIYRAYRICEEQENNLPHFIVATGKEGYGKSTLLANLLAWIYPDFEAGLICDKAKKYLDIVTEKINRYLKDRSVEPTAILLDEGTEAMARDAQQLTNKALIKTFFIQRKLKIVVGICQPNFFALDTIIREHHTHTLLHIYGKEKSICRFRCFSGKAIHFIANQGLKHSKNVMAVTVPDGFFFDGYCHLKFPKTIPYEEYEIQAVKSIKETVSELNEGVKKQLFVPVPKAAKKLGVGLKALRNNVINGEIKGKQVGGRWFLEREEYEKLCNGC